MSTSKEERALKLFIVLTRSMQAVKKKVEEDIRSHGLNTTEFAVLELIFHKGKQPIQRIGEKVLIASSSITYVVDKLVKKGYLTRETCSKDRRVSYAVLTEEGKTLMEQIFPMHEQAIRRITDGLTEEEKDQATELLKKLGHHATGA